MAKSRWTKGGRRAASEAKPIGWRVYYTEFEAQHDGVTVFPRYKSRRFSDQTDARSFASHVQHATPDGYDPDVSIDALYRFEVAYHDDHDRDNSGETVIVAETAEAAEEKFYDSADADGWRVASVTRL